MTNATAGKGSDFWAFSLDRYARPGVCELCLFLQDTLNADVNLLLLCLWAGQQRTALGTEAIGALADGEPGRWHRDVVVPLRVARRTMKTFPAAPEAVEIEAARTRLKSLEIETERLQQFALVRSLAALGCGVEGGESDAGASRAAALDNATRYVALLEASDGQSFAGSLRRLVELAID